MRLFFWRKSAPEPEAVNNEAPVPAPEKASRILKGVLDEPAPFAPVVKPVESEAGQIPLSRRLSVGARLDYEKARAVKAAAGLVAHADKQTAQVVSAVAEELRKQACRIAFVGQVKAGKSSLINVLVEQPGLLPADINPCTAVITRLNFGVPDKPGAGAAFTFFNRDEWHRLSLGGRTRELTDRLFPDFDWEVLKSQVKAMEERARKRLGASFEDLLGKEHIYPELQPNLLVRYVGTEYSHAESEAELAEGEYSDITKSADIFLGLGAFSFPTVLIDTPGVNDPFLVRDEITRQNLESADICVVVVTAWQRLSATDLNLLRMLRGLKKDRLIIFVNKVDEVKGGEDVVQKIGQQVAQTLEQEFPATHIPVILGSAAFAHKALGRGGGDYFAAGGFDTDAQDGNGAGAQEEDSAGLDWLRRDEIGDGGAAEAYFEKSGLLSLAVAASEMMNTGPIASAVGTASRLFDTVGRNLIAWREIEADLLSKVRSSAGRVEMELAAITGLRMQLAAKFNIFLDSLDLLEVKKVNLIKQKLSSTVLGFIPEALASASGGEAAAQASQIEVKLRIRLELAFQEAMEDVRNLLENEQELLRLELSKVLAASGLRGPAIVLGHHLSLTPSLAALSEPAALGFTEHLTGLPGSPAGGQGDGVKLEELIARDFDPIIGKLASEASRVFREGAFTFAGQSKALTFGPMDSVIERVSLALAEARAQPPAYNEAAAQDLDDTISNLKAVVEAGLASRSA